ncbi:hypothetical protein BJF85_05785 [Saccharomonospora sp. CUA-673]|uniref:hypothetical protein n=1 Tax=Saccharomonospora sp. CUA-673 TaxID=1904969 RepID=UPI00095D898F|nr:hypothetical protein [Saccharomonospora sp. CUA-673]OLT40648.1 hypothetical protein BJF85_05785 [Saccharomonospora sp. CUA-673]
MRTLTHEQARTRAQEHIDRAIAALPSDVSVTPTLKRDDAMECDRPNDKGPAGRYEVGKTYWLDDVPAERNGEVVDALSAHWSEAGFTVLADRRSSEDRFLSVQHPDDGFRMSIAESVEGDLSLGASSPCIWLDGGTDD